MRDALITPRMLGPFPLVSLAVACFFGAATYFAASRGGPEAAAVAQPQPSSLHGEAPTPREFAHLFTGLTNQMAAQQGDRSRIGNVDCVQGSRGHYMCSYGIFRETRPVECHVMQAMWTPAAVDSFRIEMSGRVGRCGSLREALRSLG
jgi:hypothetical protein